MVFGKIGPNPIQSEEAFQNSVVSRIIYARMHVRKLSLSTQVNRVYGIRSVNNTLRCTLPLAGHAYTSLRLPYYMHKIGQKFSICAQLSLLLCNGNALNAPKTRYVYINISNDIQIRARNLFLLEFVNCRDYSRINYPLKLEKNSTNFSTRINDNLIIVSHLTNITL